jgi:hypothetical protein
MSWLDDALDLLTRRPICGYHAEAPAAVEPTALAALALLGHGRPQAAAAALAWLADLESPQGSLGIDAAHPTPCWTTGWALLAWRAAIAAERRSPGTSSQAEPDPASPWPAAAERAAAWLLATKGIAEQPNTIMGHDTTLQAWPWVEGTHSWVEPTAIGLLALKSSGLNAHPRCREAVRLILDRMLPSGGWNQGNKIVLGRVLRPQIQPTGLALAALAGEDAMEQIGLSIGYLDNALAGPVSTASLSYALIGMAAHRRRPAAADRLLAAAGTETLRRGAAPYPLALAALAALGGDCPWFFCLSQSIAK